MKYRKMLSDWEAPYIQDLIRQIDTQSKETLARWAVDYAEQEILPLWASFYPEDERPKRALEAARQWLAEDIKLPEAKAVILDCHAAAREHEDNPVALPLPDASDNVLPRYTPLSIASGLPFMGHWLLPMMHWGSRQIGKHWSALRLMNARRC